MGLVDLLNPLVFEDFIFLLNNKYIILEKSVQNIEYINITNKLYKQIYQDMTEENERLFMLLAGRTLSEGQLKFFKSKLFNADLDIGQLFLTAVSCEQYDAAKVIIDFGFDMNRERELMAYELFICAQFHSKFYIDYYLSQGLIINEELLNEVLEIAKANDWEFEYENTEKLVEELRQTIIKE